jgi:hypothetical protein
MISGYTFKVSDAVFTPSAIVYTNSYAHVNKAPPFPKDPRTVPVEDSHHVSSARRLVRRLDPVVDGVVQSLMKVLVSAHLSIPYSSEVCYLLAIGAILQ